MKILIAVILLILICSATTNVTRSEEAALIMNESTFLKEFSKALEAKDQARIKEVVRQGEAIVYKVVMLLANEGIQKIAEGKDAVTYFTVAEIIAELFAEEFKEKGLLELVRVYRQYTQEMCRKNLQADDFIDQGISLIQKGQRQEALNKWRESLKIHKEIKDLAGEAKVLINIGNVSYNLSQYQEALNYYHQSLEITRRIRDLTTEVIILTNIGNVYKKLNQHKEVLNYTKQALNIFRKIGDEAGEARSLMGIGWVYCNLGQYQEALNYYKQSLEINRMIGDVVIEFGSLNNIGMVFYSLGQYQEALNYHNQSLEISRRIGDVSGEASSLTNIGNVFYDLGQDQEALHYHKQSLEIVRRIGDVKGEASSLTNIGNVFHSRGQYNKALEYYQKALEVTKNIGNLEGECKDLNNVGLAHVGLGNYAEGLNYYQHALEIERKIGDVAGEATTLLNIGNLHDNLGQHMEALKYYHEALEIYKKMGNIAGEGKTLGNMGLVYTGTGQYSEALKYHLKSFEISRKIGDIRGEASDLNNIGLVYMRFGLDAWALDHYQKALEVVRKAGYLGWECQILGNMGSVYGSLKEYNKATQIFQESINILEQIRDIETAWRSYFGLGQALWKSGRGDEAVEYYKKAVKAIEELYHHTKGLKEEARSSMIGNKSFVYREFIELLLELYKKSPNKGYDKEAFLISEKFKSRTFQEMMAKAGAKIALSGDETFKKMVEREKQLIGEITNFRTLLTKELSKPEKERSQEIVDSVRTQLSKAEKSLADLEKEIESKYPRYADLKKPKPLTVEKLQEILKPDETLISYAVGKDKVAVFVIGKKSFKLIEIDTGKEELSKLLRRFRRGLEDVREIKDLERFKPELAYELYQKIFHPLISELKGMTKLYISADDILYTLPFEALVDKEINEKAFDEARERGGVYLSEYNTLHYLIDTYTITYLPSASVLRSLRKYEKSGYGKWTKPLIAFADPIFSEEDRDKVKEKVEVKGKAVKQKGINPETQLTAQILTRSTGSEKLERLKESAQEAEAISNELKSKKEDIYLREKATEENIYRTNLKDSRYLLFSTHGLLGGDFSGVAEPALALTLIDNPPGRDGFLTMSEVLGLDLNSELIILSACNTSGKGDKSGSGEGFVGLTRSFMYAGGKSLMVTHWSVESESARDLMVGTFKNMQKEAKPEALRKAKLTMKNSTRQKGNEKLSLSHPFFWAPFVLVGEGR